MTVGICKIVRKYVITTNDILAATQRELCKTRMKGRMNFLLADASAVNPSELNDEFR